MCPCVPGDPSFPYGSLHSWGLLTVSQVPEGPAQKRIDVCASADESGPFVKQGKEDGLERLSERLRRSDIFAFVDESGPCGKLGRRRMALSTSVKDCSHSSVMSVNCH